ADLESEALADGQAGGGVELLPGHTGAGVEDARREGAARGVRRHAHPVDGERTRTGREVAGDGAQAARQGPRVRVDERAVDVEANFARVPFDPVPMRRA